MTTKQICKALDAGQAVTLKGDPSCRICRDMFGELTVVSLKTDEPPRLATLKDKRRAIIKQ